MSDWTLVEGDALTTLSKMEASSVQCCVTSPPYFGLRDYGEDGQIGLESTLDEYVAKLVAVFAEVKRVLRDDGTLWLNLGDSYAGSWGAQSRGASDNGSSTISGAERRGGSPISGRQIKGAPKGGSRTGTIRAANCKAKDLFGVPWMVAFALRADGWYLRSEIIWAKPNPMPESVTDRPTKAHEQVFLLSKSPRYFYDADAISEVASGRAPGNKTHKHGDAYLNGDDEFGRTKAGLVNIGARDTRNKRTVWTVPSQPYPEAHFATFPPKLIEPMVLAGCPRGGVVLDPFAGSGTTLQVAVANGRSAIGIELNPEYAELCRRRMAGVTPSMFDAVSA